MSRALEDWAYQRGVQLDFIGPANPWKTRHRGVQRSAARRMPERAPIHVDRGCARQDRSVARRLQCAPTTQLARTPDAERLCRLTSGDVERRQSRFSLARTVSKRDQRQTPEQSTFDCQSIGEAYAVFRREQTPACAVVSLHVGVGVILTAKAPNRRRSLRPFGGRDDAGPRRETQGRENGHNYIARHRPRGAAARRRRILLQTQGLSRTGGSLAGIVRPLTQVHRTHGLSPILAGSATVDVASLRSTYRCTAHSLAHSRSSREIATPQRAVPRR